MSNKKAPPRMGALTLRLLHLALELEERPGDDFSQREQEWAAQSELGGIVPGDWFNEDCAEVAPGIVFAEHCMAAAALERADNEDCHFGVQEMFLQVASILIGIEGSKFTRNPISRYATFDQGVTEKAAFGMLAIGGFLAAGNQHLGLGESPREFSSLITDAIGSLRLIGQVFIEACCDCNNGAGRDVGCDPMVISKLSVKIHGRIVADLTWNVNEQGGGIGVKSP
jgi:hypothetical protein